jgi:transposase
MSVTLTSPVVCPVALELSRSTWLVGVLPPNGARVRSFAVRGGNAEGLLERLRAIAGRLAVELGRDVELKVGFEAGFDGFWLARFLLQRGVDTLVLDSSSFLVSRRGRRVKTDRIDVEAIAYILRAHLAGDPTVCRLVRIPTPEEEDAKRLSRERTRLASEKTRHVNRIRGLLALHGIRDVKGLWGGEWRAQLDALTTGDGRSLGRFLRAEIAREFERLQLVLTQMKQLEVERHTILTMEDSPFPETSKVHTLKQLAGIGELSATLLVAEVFHRQFANRRHLASYLGLAPSPYASGESRRDQGISKAGNKPARVLLVEIAWIWLRHQPASALANWYRHSFADRGARGRKVGIVAMARKLAIALWRFVEHGVLPDGAVLNGR